MIVVMKRLFQVFALLVIPEMLCAQGYVDFRNKVIGGMDAPIFDPVTGRNVSGPDVVAQLYFSRTLDGPFQSVTNAPAPLRTGEGAGYWDPGETSIRFLHGIESGSLVWLQVRVWNGAVFSSYEEAVSEGGAFGLSNTFQVQAPEFLGFPTTMTDLEPIAFVPEPTIASLVLAGGLVLVLLRIRRHR